MNTPSDSWPVDRRPSRREALSAALAAASLALLGARPAAATQTSLAAAAGPAAGPYLDAAREIAAWLASVAVDTPDGRTWPWAPASGPETQTSLYTGSPGVVLFHLELFAATGEPRWRDEAAAGADALVAAMPAAAAGVTSAGLYTGLAGIAFTLAETARIAGTDRHRAAAGRAIQLLHDSAHEVGEGVQWNDVTDIVSGSAGTTLFLLWAARTLGHESSTALAARAGHRLLELALPTPAGSEWLMSPDYTRRMPNFSHGTAGVAYALARLHAVTGEKAFLEGALSGARHLLAIGDRSRDGFRIYHHDGDGEDLFYLSWCHGPAGTARLFHQLARETGDASWSGWVRRCATATESSGIPEQRTPGFWNNISHCCGNAGVSEFFLDLHRTHGRDADASFARRSTADLLARATRGPDGMHWVQAEHRVQPDNLLAQTGLMQGAAGVGLLLLHHDAADRGAAPAIVLPDSPFGT